MIGWRPIAADLYLRPLVPQPQSPPTISSGLAKRLRTAGVAAVDRLRAYEISLKACPLRWLRGPECPALLSQFRFFSPDGPRSKSSQNSVIRMPSSSVSPSLTSTIETGDSITLSLGNPGVLPHRRRLLRLLQRGGNILMDRKTSFGICLIPALESRHLCSPDAQPGMVRLKSKKPPPATRLHLFESRLRS